jgi:hypothetical protein
MGVSLFHKYIINTKIILEKCLCRIYYILYALFLRLTFLLELVKPRQEIFLRAFLCGECFFQPKYLYACLDWLYTIAYHIFADINDKPYDVKYNYTGKGRV